MEIKSFDSLLLKTAFCCMASDGDIDKREIDLLRSICKTSPLMHEIDFEEMILSLVSQMNADSKYFIASYFNLLKETELTEEDELEILDMALKTIYADDQVEYSEIKFFKAIRSALSVSDEIIIALHPEADSFLEQDIMTDSYFKKLTVNYLKSANLPQFDLSSILSSNSPLIPTKDV